MLESKNLHILIAEDDADDAFIIKDSFEQHPDFNNVVVVSNGQKLLDYLDNNPLPDMILTDINMPVMDGIEALKTIFSTNKFHKIPCFVYSTSINPSHKDECEKLGVKGFIVKPYSLEEFETIPQQLIDTMAEAESFS